MAELHSTLRVVKFITMALKLLWMWHPVSHCSGPVISVQTQMLRFYFIIMINIILLLLNAFWIN